MLGSQKGNLFVKKEVSFNFEDASDSFIRCRVVGNVTIHLIMLKMQLLLNPTILLINTLRHHIPTSRMVKLLES